MPSQPRMMLEVWTARKIMKKLQVMAEVDTTDFRSGLNHSADKCLLAS